MNEGGTKVTLKEKLAYSFMAISLVLGSSVYAAEKRDDSDLFGSTSGTSTTRLPQSSADLTPFDASLFESLRGLLVSQQPKKTTTSHEEGGSDDDEQTPQPSASQQRIDLSSAAAAATLKKDKDGDVDDEVGRTSAADSDGMSVPQAVHLLTNLASGTFPGAHLQVSGMIPDAKKPSKEGGKSFGLMLGGFDDDDQEHSASRDDHPVTRSVDHHGDSHGGHRGVFQEPLRRTGDGFDIPDLARLGTERSSSSHSRSGEDEALKKRIRFNLLRYGELLELDFVHLSSSLESTLLDDRFGTLQEAGDVCVDLLKNYYRLINGKKGKSEDASVLYAKRTSIMEYIRTKTAKEMPFVSVLLNLIKTERFQISSRISTEDPNSLLNLKVHQAVLTPIANVLVRTVNLSEYARIESIINEFLISNENLIRAEIFHNLGKTSQRGPKIREDLDKWMSRLVGIPLPSVHTSHPAVVQEKAEKKTAAVDHL